MDVNDKEISNNDPQFVNLLKTCLKMEIAAGNKKLDGKYNKYSVILSLLVIIIIANA